MSDEIAVSVEARQREQPTVGTFLIADVRGYTRYTLEHGDEAAARLALRFAEIAGEVVTPRGGDVIELRGDEALAVFSSPRNAMWAAVELQARLAEEQDEDPSLPLKVGVGLDSGEAVPVPGGYRGAALNLAARLCSMANPGEVLVSEGVVHLCRKVPGLTYVGRGQTRLKGFPDPVRITQVVRDEEVPEHVSRYSVSDVPGNLPADVTPFVGRPKEVAAITSLLANEEVRLLTLTGTAGTGKTRMAIQVGTTLLDDFAGNVFFQALEAIDEPALVPAALAATLGVKESSGRDATGALRQHLAGRKTLLILDNFEHLLEGAPFLGDLLAGCPQLKLLVTSRAPLRLAGERCFEIPPMRVPPLDDLPPLEELAHTEAVGLFVQRAQAVNPEFALTSENARAVAEICVQLDGLPLAIELCAARVRVLPPAALLRQLSHKLRLLVHGPRNAPARHRTLRQAIGWSYELLTAPQQQLLARLSVFAGGWTLEAAEALGSDEDSDVFDELESLVENSLVRSMDAGGESRFSMLETVREYAVEQLQALGLEPDVRRRHARYFEELAASLSKFAPSPERFRRCLETLEAEHDNVRAALSWSIQVTDADLALRLVGSLWTFWWTGGHFSEGSRWAESALALEGGASALRAGALEAGGIMAWASGDLLRARNLLTSALELYEQESNVAGMGSAISTLGGVAEQQGDFDEATRLHTRYLEIARTLGDDSKLGTALGNLGYALLASDPERAEQLLQESLAIFRRLGKAHGTLHQLNPLAFLALERGNVGVAIRLQLEALELCRALGNREILASTLDGAGRVLSARADHSAAASLWGAAGAIRESIGQAPDLMARSTGETYVRTAKAGIGERSFAVSWESGRSTDPDQALSMAISLLSTRQVVAADTPSRQTRD